METPNIILESDTQIVIYVITGYCQAPKLIMNFVKDSRNLATSIRSIRLSIVLAKLMALRIV